MGHAPSAFVRHTDGADFAGLDGHIKGAEHVHHVIHRLRTVLARGIKRPVLAEHVRTAHRPVHLIKVDVVGLEALERVVDCFSDHLTVVALAVADPTRIVAGDFRRDHHVSAATRGRDPIADDLFGLAHGFLADRVYGIHLGGVDKVDPRRQRHINLAVRVVLRGLVAVSHRAQAPI